MDFTNEKETLEQIRRHSLCSAGACPNSIKCSCEVLSRFIRGDSLLEMGPAEGVMTERLAPLGERYPGIAGEIYVVARAKQGPANTFRSSVTLGWLGLPLAIPTRRLPIASPRVL